MFDRDSFLRTDISTLRVTTSATRLLRPVASLFLSLYSDIYIQKERERESPQQQTDATRYILCLAFVCQEEKEEISRFRILL